MKRHRLKTCMYLAMVFSSFSSTRNVYLCTCTHTQIMGTKTISIKEEAYEALLREKVDKESFTDIILRITKKSGKLADCFGTWKMTDEEQALIESNLRKGWSRAREKMLSEVP